MAESSRMAPARRRGLADEVADSIREAVFSGFYAPGAQLREVELAQSLDVSRGPVREALLRLEGEGLVRSVWHRGATVTALSPDDVAEIDTLRGALEDLAVRQVIANAAEDDLEFIAQTAGLMDRAVDSHELVRLDIAFHDAVFGATGHRRLAEAWQALRCQVHLFLLTRIGLSTEGYIASIPREHRELVAALRSRNTEAALELFAVHRRHAVAVIEKG